MAPTPLMNHGKRMNPYLTMKDGTIYSTSSASCVIFLSPQNYGPSEAYRSIKYISEASYRSKIMHHLKMFQNQREAPLSIAVDFIFTFNMSLPLLSREELMKLWPFLVSFATSYRQIRLSFFLINRYPYCSTKRKSRFSITKEMFTLGSLSL